ncbi:MAG: uridine kinase [bacterium]|nr:uridine kinase [bacterium]
MAESETPEQLVTGDGRTHVSSGLMRESLVSSRLLAATDGGEVRAMVPNIHMIAIGGSSIMDRGADALLPLTKTIAEISDEGYKFVLGVGGGARARHTLMIGLDLGLPVGGLARIVGGIEEQNRDMLQFLLAPHGAVTLIKEHFQDLQLFLSKGMIPICIGQPPYHAWEPPAREGRLPENGSDVGLFLMAELLGAPQMVFVKDVDGIFEEDPRKNPNAAKIDEISAAELLERDLPELPIEVEVLRCLENTRLLSSFRVINGLKPQMLRDFLQGKPVGTRVYRSAERNRA